MQRQRRTTPDALQRVIQNHHQNVNDRIINIINRDAGVSVSENEAIQLMVDENLNRYMNSLSNRNRRINRRDSGISE